MTLTTEDLINARGPAYLTLTGSDPQEVLAFRSQGYGHDSWIRNGVVIPPWDLARQFPDATLHIRLPVKGHEPLIRTTGYLGVPLSSQTRKAYAECTCGEWIGRTLDTTELAYEDGLRHIREQVNDPDGEVAPVEISEQVNDSEGREAKPKGRVFGKLRRPTPFDERALCDPLTDQTDAMVLALQALTEVLGRPRLEELREQLVYAERQATGKESKALRYDEGNRGRAAELRKERDEWHRRAEKVRAKIEAFYDDPV